MSSRLTSNLSKSYVIIFYSEFLKSEHILLHQKHLSQEEAIIIPVYELNTIRMSTCVGASKREKGRERILPQKSRMYKVQSVGCSNNEDDVHIVKTINLK